MDDNQRQVLAETVTKFLERREYKPESLESSDLLIKPGALDRCMNTSVTLEESDVNEARRLIEFFGEEWSLQLTALERELSPREILAAALEEVMGDLTPIDYSVDLGMPPEPLFRCLNPEGPLYPDDLTAADDLFEYHGLLFLRPEGLVTTPPPAVLEA